jgi:hypothetical protein
MRPPTSPWVRVVLLAGLLALTALVSNITTDAEISGRLVTYGAARRSVSVFVNAGTFWAGLSILAGWLVSGVPDGGRDGARAWSAAAAGALAGVAALVIHYGVGALTGLMEWGDFASNVPWFVIAAVTGPVLGLIGRLARRPSGVGLAARLVVPIAALVEPLQGGWLTLPSLLGVPTVLSHRVAGVVLMAGGCVAAVAVLRTWRPT